MNTSFRLGIALIMSLIVIGLSGCKSKTETYTSDKGTVTVEQKGDQSNITYTSKEGKTTQTMEVNQAKLPDDWPAELPVMEGGTIVFSQSMSEGEQKAQQIHIDTSASVADAKNFYENKLKSAGWNIEGTASMQQMTVMNAAKDNHVVMIQIMTDEGKTRVIINLSKEK